MELPYDITDRRIEYAHAEPLAIKVGWWRGVSPNNNVFAIESMMDELAKKAGKDPIAFRLAHLKKNPRLKAARGTGGAEIRLGPRIARPPWPRHLRPVRLRHLYGDGGRSRSGE